MCVCLLPQQSRDDLVNTSNMVLSYGQQQRQRQDAAKSPNRGGGGGDVRSKGDERLTRDNLRKDHLDRTAIEAVAEDVVKELFGHDEPELEKFDVADEGEQDDDDEDEDDDEEEEGTDNEDASSTNSSDFGTPMTSAEFIRTHAASDSGKDTACCSSNSSDLHDLLGREGHKESDAVLRLDDMCRQLATTKQRQRKEVFVVRVTRVTSILRSEGRRRSAKFASATPQWPGSMVNVKRLVRRASSSAKSGQGKLTNAKKAKKTPAKDGKAGRRRKLSTKRGSPPQLS